MAKTESAPVQKTRRQRQIEKIVESWEGLKPKHKQPPVERILIRRRKPERPDVIPTEIAGVALRAEHGTKPRVTLETLGGLVVVASEYVSINAEVKKALEEREKLNKGIKDVTRAHNGLRGIQSQEDNWGLDVAPRYTVDVDAKELKPVLGFTYEQVVGKRLEATLGIPEGYPTNQGPLTPEMLRETMIATAAGLGVPKEHVGLAVGIEENLTVNDDLLGKMLVDGRLNSLGGAAKITKEEWAINVVPLTTA